MKWSIDKIAYKNIMSVGAQPVVIDFASNKKVLITGKNGGGKSTLLEALCLGLFNKPFRSIKKGQLINSINKKALLVEIWFNDGKHHYYIKRGIKPNVFEITRDGQEIPEAASVKDFQTMFEEEIIKMNIQSFKQTIVLGTAGYTPFMELTASARRTLIEDLINLSVFSNMDMLNKTVIKEVKSQMDTIEGKINGARNTYEAHMHHINRQKSMSDGFIAQLQADYDNSVALAKACQDMVHDLNAQIANIVVSENYRTQIDKCRTALQMIEFKSSGILTNLKFFHENDNCPTCKQKIDSEFKAYESDRLGREQADLTAKRDAVKSQYEKYTELQKVVDDAQREINNLSSQLSTQKSVMASHIQTANATKAKIAAAETLAVIDTSGIDKIEQELRELRDQKTALFEEMYARKIVLNLLKDSGIKADVIQRYIPIINQKINQYLKMLGADYTFTLDSEFNEIIKSRGREDFSYMSFSQGEKARIDLSLLFTWRDVAAVVSGTEINLLILDEIADGATDGEGVLAIHNILDGINGNVVVISHREEHDRDRFDQHIRMIKKGRFSIME